MKYQYLILTVICLLIGCKEKDVELQKSIFSKTERIDFKNIFEFKEGVPAAMHLKDSALVIHSFDSEFVFYNYTINNGKLSKGYVNMGRGPNELIGPIASGIVGNKLWVYDITYKKILTLNYYETSNPDSISTFMEYPLYENYYKIAFKDSLTFLGVRGDAESGYPVYEENLIKKGILDKYGENKNELDPREKAFQRANQNLYI